MKQKNLLLSITTSPKSTRYIGWDSIFMNIMISRKKVGVDKFKKQTVNYEEGLKSATKDSEVSILCRLRQNENFIS